tara:strand:+ start:573 stop:1604 length:1032 start_codon:yes stop_codon:yes gene_type:complete
MAFTKPTGDQIRFRSSTTGEHTLDAYLEAAEKGGRSIPDLLDDLFDSNGSLDANTFQFRVNTSTFKLQVRVGVTGNQSPYVDVPDGSFFNPRGNFAPSTDYIIHDLFHYNDNLYMVTANHTSGAQPDAAATFIAVAGAAGSIPQTRTQLAGRAGNLLRINQQQNGYDIVPFADTNIFFGLSNDAGNGIELTEVGKDLALIEASVLQSLINKANNVTDPLVTDGFWNRTYTDAGGTFTYFDGARDTNATVDAADIQAYADVISGTVTSGDFYTAYTTVIKPYLTANQSTYQNMLIPINSSTEKLFGYVISPSNTPVDPTQFSTWFLGNGNTEISIVDNQLVMTI